MVRLVAVLFRAAHGVRSWLGSGVRLVWRLVEPSYTFSRLCVSLRCLARSPTRMCHLTRFPTANIDFKKASDDERDRTAQRPELVISPALRFGWTWSRILE